MLVIYASITNATYASTYAGAMSPTARSMNRMIRTVHSFLMHHLSLLRSWYVLKANISSMKCKDNVTYYT